MSLSKRVTELSPEKRRLLALLMKEQSIAPAVLPVARAERNSNVLPVSFAQQRLWFLDHLEPGNLAYIIPGSFRFDGPLDLHAFTESVNEVIRRHEILRTSFTDIDGEPMQVIEEPQKLTIPLIDLSDLPESARAAEIHHFTQEEAGRAFDLERAPLLRITLLKLGDEEHIVLLTMHHIISDGWSMNVLLQEVSALYEAFTQGKGTPLPKLPIQYSDYSVWQREHLQGDVLEAQLAYWRKQLQDAPPVLELPGDRPRPPVRASRGACISFAVPAKVTEGLRTLSRREGTTMFMTLLAAFKVLLYRYTGQSRIVVGTAVAGRNRKELEGLIGFFVNTLVLHTDLSRASSFRDVLARVKETAVGAYAHQDLPFERLVEEFQAGRSLSYTPLFQVFFALENAPRESKELTGLKTEALGEQSRTSQFDLSLNMMEAGERMGGSFEYNTDLFEGSTIKRMIGHFENLLGAIAERPDKPVGRLRLLDEQEEQQQLVTWNATTAAAPAATNLHQLVEASVARTPDAIAVSCGSEAVTYKELNRRAEALAGHLRQRGVRAEDRVALLLERSVETVVAILGVLKSGGAYVPLDPAYPVKRLQWVLADGGIKLLLTEREVLERVFGSEPVTDTTIVYQSECEAEVGSPSEQEVSGEQLAYVIYTSGSTGQPKGVCIEHRQAVSLVHWGQQQYTEAELTSVLASTSLCFDLSIFELFVTLSAGGTVVMAANALALAESGGGAEQITLVNTVPSAMRELIRLQAVPESVGIVNLAGEALPAALVEELYGLPQIRAVYNLYGPSEDTTYSTGALVERGAKVTIGRSLPHKQAHVLGAELELLPVGVTGELYLAGAGLARGYLKAAAQTAERFVPHPYSAEPGARLYRTGDLGRWQMNGEVEFLGRRDHQIKIRGFRIELGEIESVLTEHKDVREVAVIATESGDQNKRLTAYVVMKSDVDLSAAELRRFVAERLPSHMVPAGFVSLKELPLTKNGKIDRAALSAAETLMPGPEQDFVAARTPIEEILCGIWMELLSVERVGVYDNFFQLGGHSLLATRVLARIRETFEIELPLISLFESPTIASLAERIEFTTSGGLLKPAIERIPRDRALPVSYTVEQRLRRDLRALENSAPIRPQTIHNAVRWSGPLDRNAFEQSVNEIVRRHEILRTSFELIDGEPVQFISEKRTLKVPFIDLQHLEPEARNAEAIRLATYEVKQPFDLSQDLLVRMTVLRLEEDQYMVVFVADDAVCDGWSIDVFFTEFTALYNAFTRGEPAPLAELPFQYADYSHWQRNWLQGEVLENLLSYWKKQLAGHEVIPRFELPVARRRSETLDFSGASQVIVFPAELTHAIQSLSRHKGITIFMMLLAGLKALLHRHSGRESIGVISPAAYRTPIETEGLIGWFAQQLVLRTDMSGDPSFSELLERVREVTLGAFTHQDIPLPYLMKEFSPQVVDAKSIPHVFFNLDNQVKGMPIEEGKDVPVVSGVGIRQVHIDPRASESGLRINIKEHASAVDVLIQYDTLCYDTESIGELLKNYESLMAAAVANPELRLSQLALHTIKQPQMALPQK